MAFYNVFMFIVCLFSCEALGACHLFIVKKFELHQQLVRMLRSVIAFLTNSQSGCLLASQLQLIILASEWLFQTTNLTVVETRCRDCRSHIAHTAKGQFAASITDGDDNIWKKKPACVTTPSRITMMVGLYCRLIIDCIAP